MIYNANQFTFEGNIDSEWFKRILKFYAAPTFYVNESGSISEKCAFSRFFLFSCSKIYKYI